MTERSLIAGVFSSDTPDHHVARSLKEMVLLTESAGGEVVESLYQKREVPDRKTMLGKGKTAEIAGLVNKLNLQVIIIMNSLSPLQQRNLESILNIKVIDRTRLILDIFATRARSLEGKLQVEMAQLLYLLPRLTGRGVELSRLGGGIGTRGPGETKLETDRRVIKKKIAKIRRKLEKVIRHRDLQRKSRSQYPVPVVSLAGYTSAGKSTLFRKLTGQQVHVSAQLFSTLDPLLRRVDMSGTEPGLFFLLSDTVGFIRDMPAELFKAFQATLEEVVCADLVLNVVDVSSDDRLDQKSEVIKILSDIRVPPEKVVTVYNKVDLVKHDKAGTEYSRDSDADQTLFVSALTGHGLNELKHYVYRRFFRDFRRAKILVPKKDFNPDSIRRWAIVTAQKDRGDRVELEVLCSPEKVVQFKKRSGGSDQ